MFCTFIGQGIIHLYPGNAFSKQRFDHFDGGGVPHVICMLFERKSQHCNCPVIEFEGCLGDGSLNEIDFLILIDLVGGFEHLGADIDASQLIDQGSNVFSETTAPGSVAHK